MFGIEMVTPFNNWKFPFDDFGVDDLVCRCYCYQRFAVILENTQFQHGYSQTSKVVGYLLDVLTEFTPKERRAFLKFVTGTPRLPVGGTVQNRVNIKTERERECHFLTVHE
jgi:E3 ubiquitin-protein ligase TRIP12